MHDINNPITEIKVGVVIDPVIIPASELIALGYVQEANRKFFHPRGIALAVDPTVTGGFYAQFYDARDDPEGYYFAKETLNTSEARRKADNMAERMLIHSSARINLFGYPIQPIPNMKGEVIHGN